MGAAGTAAVPLRPRSGASARAPRTGHRLAGPVSRVPLRGHRSGALRTVMAPAAAAVAVDPLLTLLFAVPPQPDIALLAMRSSCQVHFAASTIQLRRSLQLALPRSRVRPEAGQRHKGRGSRGRSEQTVSERWEALAQGDQKMTMTASNKGKNSRAQRPQHQAEQADASAFEADVLMSRWRAATAHPLGAFWPRPGRWPRAAQITPAATSAPAAAGS